MQAKTNTCLKKGAAELWHKTELNFLQKSYDTSTHKHIATLPCEMQTRSSADANKPTWRHNQVRRCVAKLLRIFYFEKGGCLPYWILLYSQLLWKIQICAYIFVVLQNLVKIGWCAAELLCIFDFQNRGRPPSWIFIFSQFFWKIQICTYIYIVMPKFGEDQTMRGWVA